MSITKTFGGMDLEAFKLAIDPFIRKSAALQPRCRLDIDRCDLSELVGDDVLKKLHRTLLKKKLCAPFYEYVIN